MNDPQTARIVDDVAHDFDPQSGELHDLFGHGEDVLPKDDLVMAAQTYLRLRREKEEIEAQQKSLGAVLRQAEQELLQKMAESGVSSIKLDWEGSTCGISSSTSAHYTLPAGLADNQSVIVWLMKNGGHDLVKKTVHHASFSSFCRELVERGGHLHPLVRVVEQKVARVKRETP